MPIPRINKQAQFQAPKVAEGKAVDASKQIAQAYEPAFHTLDLLNQTTDSVLKFSVAEQRATASYNAQNAINEYIEGINQLDRQFQTYTYEEAQKQLPKYYEQAQALHNKFVQSIDNINVTDIRENYRQQVNNFNIKQKEQTEAFVYKQKKIAEQQTLQNGLTLQEDLAARSVNPYASAEDNYLAFTSVLAKGLGDIENDGLLNYKPKEVVEVEKQEFIGKAFAKAALEMSTRVDTSISDDPYKGTRDFIYSMRGQVPEDVWKNVARTYEKQSLDLAFNKDPEKFVKDGKFNDSSARIYAPNLTAQERAKHIKDIQDATAANGNINDGILAAELQETLIEGIRKDLQDSGYYTKGLWDIDNAVDEWSDSDFEKRRNQKGSYTKLFDSVRTLEGLLNGDFYYNGLTKEYIPASNSINGQAMERQGYRKVSLQPADTATKNKYKSTLKKLQEELGQMSYNGKLDDAEYTSGLFAISPSMDLDVSTFLYQYNYNNTKVGFIQGLGNKITGKPRELGMSSDMMYRGTKTLQNNIAEAKKKINDYRIQNKLPVLNDNIYNKSTYELIQYFDDLTQSEPIKYIGNDGKEHKVDYWQVFEQAFASALPQQFQPSAINALKSGISSQSPSQNYSDFNNADTQLRQLTMARDFFYAREENAKRNAKTFKRGLPSGFLGTESIFNPLKVSVTDRPKIFKSFADNIIED